VSEYPVPLGRRKVREITYVSVIIPSRLQAHPLDSRGGLWLERALASVRAQSVNDGVRLEIVVGLDPDASLPQRLSGVRFAHGSAPSQAHAVNAAVAAAQGEVLAFLEDDDYWLPRRLEYGLAYLDSYALVTANQLEVTAEGTFKRIFDFPTPSGWLLRRTTWELLGPLDGTLRFHVDSDYLGRVNARALPRMHLVEREAEMNRRKLQKVARFSDIAATGEPKPLVIRTMNDDGGMARIERDASAKEQSRAEHDLLRSRYGRMPS
jgi:glycosyltransferase involved in cell wall biosynthesis